MTNASPTTAARDLNGARFAWREAGAGPTLLLLHGLGGSRLSWEPQLAGLSDQFRVVAWDLPGYGDGPPLADEVRFDTLATAVVRLIDELAIDRIHLAGISFGGMIAQYVAAAHPDRLLTLCLLATSARFGLDGTSPESWRAARLAPLEAGRQPSEFADEVLGGIAGPNLSDMALQLQITAMGRITAAALSRSIECLITHDATSLLGSVVTPTQVLVGELDRETPPAYGADLAERIPHAQLHVIQGAGHLLNAEAPDEVNALIAAHAGAAPR